jgi:hypothetical protein
VPWPWLPLRLWCLGRCNRGTHAIEFSRAGMPKRVTATCLPVRRCSRSIRQRNRMTSHRRDFDRTNAKAQPPGPRPATAGSLAARPARPTRPARSLRSRRTASCAAPSRPEADGGPCSACGSRRARLSNKAPFRPIGDWPETRPALEWRESKTFSRMGLRGDGSAVVGEALLTHGSGR